ncbi:MAG: hypothetical protein HY609_04530 [Deltaproteobacteria bacterium]|nr:hypothetical protein [Deltaproteobacteria bacterium]MBI4224176.1 hypothetical protein [Deltaproteobacteria bacterium]
MARIGSRIAVVVNGDTEQRHLDNAERMAQTLRTGGYDVFLLNSYRLPGVKPDHYFPPTQKGLRALQKKLKLAASPDADLVIATTGHGSQVDGKGTLCLEDGCDGTMVASVLNAIPHRQRTVYMDQCYGGNWNKVFLSDPKTLFISLGSKGEIDSCEEMNPYFWSDQVPDLNGDKVVNWRERYTHAFPHVTSSTPQFVPSEGYRPAGKPAFPPKVVKVADEKGLKAQLGRLRTGQYAIITFSAEWCGPCKEYKPVFDRLAREGGGQHLWLITENEELADAWGVHRYPTVVIADARGYHEEVPAKGRENVEKALADFSTPLRARLERKIAEVEKNLDEEDNWHVLMGVVDALEGAGLQGEAIPILQKLVTTAGKLQDNTARSIVFDETASFLTASGLQEKTLPVFERLISEKERMQDKYDRVRELGEIAVALARSGAKEKALPLFKKLVVAAENIQDEYLRGNLLGEIAHALARSGVKKEAQSLFMELFVAAGNIESDSSYWKALNEIIFAIVLSALKEEALPLFEVLIAEVEKSEEAEEDEEAYLETLLVIAPALARCGLRERALEVFGDLIAAAGEVEKEKERADVLFDIVLAVDGSGLKKEEAFSLYEKLLAAAGRIQNEVDREYLFRAITSRLP